MKILLICIMLIFIGCNQKSNDSRALELENVTTALLEGKKIDAKSDILEDANALISRSNIDGYRLVSTNFVSENLDDAIIISTIENEKNIPNAKIFTFAKSISLNEDGSNWNWSADSLDKNLDDFKAMLGEDKDKLIIFYDSGEDIFGPAGSAHTALIWAKHLGYDNVARVIGGLNAWVDNKL